MSKAKPLSAFCPSLYFLPSELFTIRQLHFSMYLGQKIWRHLKFLVLFLINLTFDSLTNFSRSTFKIYQGFLCLYFFFSHSHLDSNYYRLSFGLLLQHLNRSSCFCLSEYSQYNIQSHPVKIQIKFYNSSAQKCLVAYHLKVNFQILPRRPQQSSPVTSGFTSCYFPLVYLPYKLNLSEK